MRIALDAMGGDHGAPPNVAGAVQAILSDADLTVVMLGDKPMLEGLLAQAGSFPAERLELVHTTQSVAMNEKPAEALRSKPDSSIVRGWQLLATKQVDGFVSAGNTGAVVAGGLFSRKFLKCVHRPGIATVMPTAKGKAVLMDVGANVFPKPRHLLEYGVMGSVYARLHLGIAHPTVGIVNVGEEEGKGNDLVTEAFNSFRNSPLKDRFVGNIEGRDIHAGKVDVVVTDGFVGNVVIKLSQGIFEFIMNLVGHEVIASLSAEKDLAKQKLHAMIQKYHYSATGGAPLLGVDGVCIICHGSSKERAIANALQVAATNVRIKLNEAIVAELEALPKAE
ncbi:phosphate acyltransferase PlsX [soil metagenome]